MEVQWPPHEGIDTMAQRVEHHPLEAAFSALIDHGLDGAGEALHLGGSVTAAAPARPFPD